jgi:hypothetical protein
MMRLFIFYLLLIISLVFGQTTRDNQQTDRLINGGIYTSKVVPSDNGKEIALSNGLIEGKFRISLNFGCISLNNWVTSQNYLRSVRPEAQITVNGTSFKIGGLVDPSGKEKGLLKIYNPLSVPITRTIKVPVYYTALDSQVKISDLSGVTETLPVSRDYEITLETTIPSRGCQCYILK